MRQTDFAYAVWDGTLYSASRWALQRFWKGKINTARNLPGAVPWLAFGIHATHRTLAEVLASKGVQVVTRGGIGDRVVTVATNPTRRGTVWRATFDESKEWSLIDLQIIEGGAPKVVIRCSMFELGMGGCLLPTHILLRQRSPGQGGLSSVHTWAVDSKRSGYVKTESAGIRYLTRMLRGDSAFDGRLIECRVPMAPLPSKDSLERISTVRARARQILARPREPDPRLSREPADRKQWRLTAAGVLAVLAIGVLRWC